MFFIWVNNRVYFLFLIYCCLECLVFLNGAHRLPKIKTSLIFFITVSWSIHVTNKGFLNKTPHYSCSSPFAWIFTKCLNISTLFLRPKLYPLNTPLSFHTGRKTSYFHTDYLDSNEPDVIQICCIHFIQMFIFKTDYNFGGEDASEAKEVAVASGTGLLNKWWWQKLNKNAQHDTYCSSTVTSWLVFDTFDKWRATFIQCRLVTSSGPCSLILDLVHKSKNKHLPLSPHLHVFKLSKNIQIHAQIDGKLPTCEPYNPKTRANSLLICSFLTTDWTKRQKQTNSEGDEVGKEQQKWARDQLLNVTQRNTYCVEMHTGETQVCVCVCWVDKVQFVWKSGKDGLLASLLGQDGSRFVLGVRVVGQLWRAGGDRALQDGLLQVVEHRRVLFGEESHGHATLASTTRTTDTMDVVCRRRRKQERLLPERNSNARTAQWRLLFIIYKTSWKWGFLPSMFFAMS